MNQNTSKISSKGKPITNRKINLNSTRQAASINNSFLDGSLNPATIETANSPRESNDGLNAKRGKQFRVNIKNNNNNPYSINSNILRQTIQKQNSSNMTQKTKKQSFVTDVNPAPLSTLEQRKIK
jgi:hypothetical protein